MPDEQRYYTDDRGGFHDEGTLDPNDTLEGEPGEDSLDEGVIAPDKWSPAMRHGSTAAEEEEGESLEQLLSEEEPDMFGELDGEDEPPYGDDDEDAGDEDVDG